jgi:hypothetical protein
MAIVRKVLNMTVDERQVALTVMDHLRDDLKTAKTRDGRTLETSEDLQQYLTEQINHIRGNSHMKQVAVMRLQAESYPTD